jgi:hypothetical protein
MKDNSNEAIVFIWRVTAMHVITYFIIGMISMNIFDYQYLFTSNEVGAIMKPVTSKWVALAPGLQVIGGLFLGIVLWPFKSVILSGNGWFKLWLLFIGLSILFTFGPAIGSIDGMLYTKVPVRLHLTFLPELLVQALLLSAGIYYWYQKPSKALTILSIISVVVIVAISIAGFMTSNAGIE